MKIKEKNGKTNMMLVLLIFIGFTLIIAGVGLQLVKMGTLNLNIFNNNKNTVKEIVKIIDTTVDTVPIPTNFYYVGGTKNSGLVISNNIQDKEKGDSHELTKTLVGDQYVWVPVEDFAEFKRTLEKDMFMPKEATKSILETDTVVTGINVWEVVLGLNKPVSAKTKETLKEAQAMYASVEKYKGFYIARYEAGLDSPRVKVLDATSQVESIPFVTGQKVRSKQNAYPYNNIPWSSSYEMATETGGAVEIARSIYPSDNVSYAVVSNLVYGVQWDAVMSFFKSMPGGANKTGGNYLGSVFPFFGKYMDNKETMTYVLDSISTEKENTNTTIFTSGSTSYAKINNIYDLGGNVKEWTMEAVTSVLDDSVSYSRIVRGGSYKQTEQDAGVKVRESKIQTYSALDTGFRIALYIK